MRHRANTLAPPPPSPEMAQSPAYCALPAATRALLMLIEVEVAEQGGMIAAMNTDDICAATGMRRPALVAALTELSAAGFIVTSTIGRFCIVALSTAWRRA
jgi:DNA-binding transcriptional regulator PaaX